MEILVESSLLYAAINAIRIGLQVYSQYISEELDVRYFFPRVIAISITVGTISFDLYSSC